jgi:hypothetical protein
VILRRNLRPAVRGLIVVKWMVIAALLLVAVHEARADGAILVSPGGFSYHQDRAAGYNERNHGLSITYKRDAELAFSAGFYGNSIHRRAYFAAARFTPFAIGPLRAGAVVGAVTGYAANSGGPVPVLLPALVAEAGPIDVTVIGWPSMMGSGAGIAAQFAVRVW